MVKNPFTEGTPRLWAIGYRTHLTALAVLAALCPFAMHFIPLWYAPLAGLGLSALCLIQLSLGLRNIDEAVRRLEACALAATPPAGSGDRLLENVKAVSTRLETLNRRMRRHAITNLPIRAEFLADIAEDFDHVDNPTLMGILRFANYGQMAAFDQRAAERVLGAFGRRLEVAVDKKRPIAHVDRDCFAIWFRGSACPKAAAAELQAISYVLSEEIKDGDLVIAPDVQIGTALHPLDCDDPAALLTRAAMSIGRPQRTAAGEVSFFASRSAPDGRRRFALEQDLRRAIVRDQLFLHYQPLVDAKEGRVMGAEALLRWRHPDLGAVSPAEFVPILEESGLVHEIGLWTLNTACRQIRQWKEAGLDGLKIAVNLSAHQLRDPSLKAVIQRTLDRYDLVPQCLELELTETAAMEDADRTLDLFRDLRQLGFGVAIDDFGAGYSSLSYLKKLPFTKLKIDREFISHVDTRSSSRAICKALIELAAGLDIAVLAEGVERLEEVEQLRRLGCSMFQGFYFSKPLPADAFAAAAGNPDWLASLASPVHRERAELKRRLNP